MRRLPFALLLIAGLMLTACQPQPAYTPTPTRTPGGPAEALLPTDTPAPPTVPTAAPPPVAPSGPDSYPDGVNPLSGLPVDDPTVLDRAPLAIKVSNDPLARQQSGLSFADLVWEHYTEGAITRYTAIFYSQAPEMVGSVRSGRLIDLEIIPMYDALFSASGFSEGVRKRVAEMSWAQRNLSGPFVAEPSLVRVRREGLAEEHTLFAVPDELWKLADQRGIDNPPDLTPGMAFQPEAPPSDLAATTITINWSTDRFKVEWVYDPATGLYSRFIGGEPDTDYLTGQQITAANVMFVGARHVDTDIIEDGYNGLWSIEMQVWGEGPASLFRDGRRYEGGWSRSDPEQMLQFADEAGNSLFFKPGNTWFEVVPLGFDRLTTES